MLEWLLSEHQQVAKRLKAVQMEACRLEGGLAALEEALKHLRETGGGSVAAPAPTQQAAPVAMAPRAVQGITSAVRIGHGAVQAEEELRD